MPRSLAEIGAHRRPGDRDAEEVSDEFVLPELRPMWWETGVRARAEAGLLGVFAELPALVGRAVAISWRADRFRTLLIAVTTIGSGVLATFGLLATQRVLVELFAGGPTPDRVRSALPALAVLALATALRGGLGILTGYAQNGLGPRVTQQVERTLFETTSAVRLDAFDQDAFADDMERASRGTTAAISLVDDVMNLFAGLVSLLAVTVAVVVIHPLLLLALLVATVPKAYASLRAGRDRFLTYLAGSVRRRRINVLQRQLADRDSAPELRAYHLREFLLGQYDAVMRAETAIELALARRVTTATTVGALISGVALGGVWLLLGMLLIDGRIPLAAAATCVVAVQAAQRSLALVTFQLDHLYGDGQFFKEYIGFLTRARRYLPSPALSAPAPAPLATLSVRGATLHYPDRADPAVRDITLTIQAGQTVAFVGENGSGKSTLAAVIAALRSPTAGSVEWNGRPLADWDVEELRARIGVVTQDHHRWPFTAATNIALGDLRATPSQDRIEHAAGLAAAHEMILELPHGYATLLDRTFKDGQDLSGGQWQRITAARGFLRDADLLIMDEPSSALDPRAEDALFQAIRSRQGRRTTILITHRLANVIHADQIFVLHEGVLEESGSHAELMASGGRYAELFSMQAAGYRSS